MFEFSYQGDTIFVEMHVAGFNFYFFNSMEADIRFDSDTEHTHYVTVSSDGSPEQISVSLGN